MFEFDKDIISRQPDENQRLTLVQAIVLFRAATCGETNSLMYTKDMIQYNLGHAPFYSLSRVGALIKAWHSGQW